MLKHKGINTDNISARLWDSLNCINHQIRGYFWTFQCAKPPIFFLFRV